MLTQRAWAEMSEEDYFRDNGKKKICLNSTLNAAGFYQKMGFEGVQEMNFRLSTQSVKMIRMEKFLQA